MKTTRVLVVIIIILAVTNILSIWTCVSSKISERDLETKVSGQKVNTDILNFTQLFVDKILDGSKDVSFDDRLQLENAVRNLNDKEILESWQVFTKAKNSAEVQKDFYSLFQLLLKKITP